ncbi:MAG: hydratase [Hydrococcus sp. C42_A2020_068]|nr:hydratase [Hydrococcus sp. C42_A2020_068]
MKKNKVFVLSFLIALQIIFLQSVTPRISLSKIGKEISRFKQNQKSITIAQFNNRALAKEIADRYLKKIPLQSLPDNLTLGQALQVQDQFVRLLVPSYGKPVGYKAGLTNKDVQAKFNSDRPVSGILLEKMLLKSGATVPANFGTRPLIEGDLMVRVGSETINTARTPQEVLAALDAVIPFLELPDLVYAENIKLTAPKIVAINVGARSGIMGESIPLTNINEWQEKLGKIQLIIRDRDGKQLAIGESKTLLGDPVKAIVWLRDDLQSRGKFLKKGDLLSLGTITPVISVKSKMIICAQYIGLDDNLVKIFVKFK